MGDAFQPPLARGIIIPDDRLTAANYSTTHSTWDENGPIPGIPVPQQQTDAVLESGGSQSAGGALRVKTASGGQIGEARFIWQQSGDATWRGYDRPFNISYIESLNYTTSATGTRNPHIAALPNGKIVASHDGRSGSTALVRSRTRGTDGTWAAAVTVYSETENTDQDVMYTSVVPLPSGRVLVFYTQYDDDNNRCNVGYSYSDDDGATWTAGGSNILSTSLSVSTYNIRRLRVAYNAERDEMLMFIWTGIVAGGNYGEVLHQFASASRGGRFDLVESWTQQASTNGGAPDIAVRRGIYHVAWFLLDDDSDQDDVRLATLGSAYDKLSLATWDDPGLGASGGGAGTDPLDTLSGDANIALVCTPEDNLVLLYSASVPTTLSVGISTDGGGSWVLGGNLYTDAGNGCSFRHVAATFQRGRVVAISNSLDNGSTYDNSLWVLYLGGYTDVELPLAGTAAAPLQPFLWNRQSYFPVDLPGSDGWTVGTSGTTSETLTGGVLNTTVDSVGGTQNYAYAPASTIAQGIEVLYACRVNSGAAVLRIRNADATNEYEIEIQQSATSIVLVDTNAGNVGSPDVITGRLLILAVIQGANAAVWYRTADTGEDREWTLLANTTTLTDNSSLTTNRVRFGHDGSVGGADDADWSFVMVGSGQLGPNVLAAVPTNPDDLRGRLHYTSHLYVDDGTTIRMKDGPTFAGDTWNIDVDHQYPVENCFVAEEPSPSRPARSASVTTDMTIAWLVDSNTEDAHSGSSLMGLFLRGVNFPTFTWRGRSSGSWGTLASVDARWSIGFARHGHTIIPTTGGASGTSIYIPRNGMAGGYMQFNNGDVRRISRNTEGWWDAGAIDEKRPVLFLEDTDGGEPSNHLSGACYLWPRDILVLYHELGDATYEGYQLLVNPTGSSVTPAESYFEIGTIAMGPVAVFGTNHSWQWTETSTTNVELVEERDGRRRTRKMGERRRAYELAWREGIWQYDVYSNLDPDYLEMHTNASAQPVAGLTDTALMLRGLIEEIAGSHGVVVYVPAISQQTGSTQVQTFGATSHEAGGALLGRLSDEWSWDNFAGNERVDNAGRLSGIRIEEEL